jgi:AP-2 complex subunit mu-1
VIEKVNLICSSTGTTLSSNISGSVMMRAYLSGMPECRFGINDKLWVNQKTGGGSTATVSRDFDSNGKPTVNFDDCQFHQCVRLGSFNSERTITFIPPGLLLVYLI